MANSSFSDPQRVEDITPQYLTTILRRHTGHSDLTVRSCASTVLKPGLISGLSGGLLRLQLEYEGFAAPDWPRALILKANPSDKTIHEHMLAGARRRGLDSLLPLMPNLGFNRREVMSYRYLPGRIPIGMPDVYHTVLDESGNRLWIFLEDISNLDLLDAWEDLSLWNDERLKNTVRDLARFHAAWWGRAGEWRSHDWLIRSDPPLWSDYVRAAIVANAEMHPGFVTQARLPLLERLADALPAIARELRKQPHTLIHGDCTPRNACFRPMLSGSQLILYDWALTSIRPPQQDLAKFIMFVLDPATEMSRLRALIGEYLNHLPARLLASIDRDFFHQGFDIACLYYLSVYLTVCFWRVETDELRWLFREFEHRLRFAELVSDKWLTHL